jgi:hypothetical protein
MVMNVGFKSGVTTSKDLASEILSLVFGGAPSLLKKLLPKKEFSIAKVVFSCPNP